MQIKNKDNFDDVDFLPDTDVRVVGDVGGIPLVILGFEQGTKSPVVSRLIEGKDYYFAIPLYELMSHSQDSINISEKLE